MFYLFRFGNRNSTLLTTHMVGAMKKGGRLHNHCEMLTLNKIIISTSARIAAIYSLANELIIITNHEQFSNVQNYSEIYSF